MCPKMFFEPIYNQRCIMNESKLRKMVSGILREIIEESRLEEDKVISQEESKVANKQSELTDEKSMEQKWAEAEESEGKWASNLGYVNGDDKGILDKSI